MKKTMQYYGWGAIRLILQRKNNMNVLIKGEYVWKL